MDNENLGVKEYGKMFFEDFLIHELNIREIAEKYKDGDGNPFSKTLVARTMILFMAGTISEAMFEDSKEAKNDE